MYLRTDPIIKGSQQIGSQIVRIQNFLFLAPDLVKSSWK